VRSNASVSPVCWTLYRTWSLQRRKTLRGLCQTTRREGWRRPAGIDWNCTGSQIGAVAKRPYAANMAPAVSAKPTWGIPTGELKQAQRWVSIKKDGYLLKTCSRCLSPLFLSAQLSIRAATPLPRKGDKLRCRARLRLPGTLWVCFCSGRRLTIVRNRTRSLLSRRVPFHSGVWSQRESREVLPIASHAY